MLTIDDVIKIQQDVYDRIDITNEVKEIDTLILEEVLKNKIYLEIPFFNDKYKGKFNKLIEHYKQAGFLIDYYYKDICSFQQTVRIYFLKAKNRDEV